MRSIFIGAALVVAATQAGAVITGSATGLYTEGGGGLLTTFDSTLPAIAEQRTGTDAAAGNIDFLSDGFARAEQNVFGFSTVRTDANFFGPGSGPRTLIAETVFAESITNTTGVTQNYAFDIFLKDMFVDIYDFGGVSALAPNPFDGPSDAIGGRLSYEVTINGGTVYAFIAEVWGGNAGVSVDQSKGTDGVAPDGSIVSSTLGTTGRSESFAGGFGFESFFATIDAGTFANGESIDLVATMQAEITAFPFEQGAVANIGDPNDLSGSGVGPLTAASVPPIPLPAGAWLLLGGLGALAAMRRRAA